MKTSHKIFLAFLAFVIGFSLGLNFKIMYESSTFKPYGWESPPKVVNCYGKEFSKLQMKRAMSYWEVRGYNLGEYMHNPPKEICDKEWVQGVIILRKSTGLPTNTLASTRRYATFMVMQGAVIRYQPGSFNLDLLNEHEIGHALGFTHLDIVNHIMHPRYDKMGRNFWIPAG